MSGFYEFATELLKLLVSQVILVESATIVTSIHIIWLNLMSTTEAYCLFRIKINLNNYLFRKILLYLIFYTFIPILINFGISKWKLKNNKFRVKKHHPPPRKAPHRRHQSLKNRKRSSSSCCKKNLKRTLMNLNKSKSIISLISFSYRLEAVAALEDSAGEPDNTITDKEFYKAM